MTPHQDGLDREHGPRVHVVHATSPLCHWSWGYEAALNRLRMVYGDQVDVVLRLGSPYEDRDAWLEEYGMTAKETEDWINQELPDVMDVPLAPVVWDRQPRSCMPAVLAVQAARRQDEERAWKLNRALLRRFAVEGKDPTPEAEILAAATQVGLDAARLKRDLADEAALREEYEAQGSRGPPVHVGFYNVVVTDGQNRRVVLDYVFDPEELEAAVDFISRGTLTKRAVGTDIAAYLREHGWAPLSEVGRVFGLDAQAATAALEKLERSGSVERATIANAPHWRARA